MDENISVCEVWVVTVHQNHPKYLNGEMTEEDLYNKFLANFETNKLVGDNVSLQILFNHSYYKKYFKFYDCYPPIDYYICIQLYWVYSNKGCQNALKWQTQLANIPLTGLKMSTKYSEFVFNLQRKLVQYL